MGRKEKQKYQKHKKEVEALDELEAVASFANPKEGQNWNAIFFMFCLWHAALCQHHFLRLRFR